MNNTCETKESCKAKILQKLKDSTLQIIGLFAGGIGGYVYYREVGCASGACPITSNPWLSIIWGAVTCYLIASIFIKKNRK